MRLPYWLKRIPFVSILVTAACAFLAFRLTSALEIRGPTRAASIMDPRVRVFVWGESWRSRMGRIMPDASDWVAIFTAIKAAGARQVVIPAAEVFSRVNAVAPGYIQAFRDASAAGISVYAPLFFIEPGAGTVPADPTQSGLPVEKFIADSKLRGETSLSDLRRVPDVSSRLLSGPAPEFLDAIAGAGLVASEPDRFFPLLRWREDRFVADLGLTPRGISSSVSLDGGDVFVGANRIALVDGAVTMPAVSVLNSGALPFDSIESLLDRGAVADLSGVRPEIVILGPDASGAVTQVAATANAGVRGELPRPAGAAQSLILCAMATVSLMLAMLPWMAPSMALAVAWVILCAASASVPGLLPQLHWLAVVIAAAGPSTYELVIKSARRDRRMRIIAAGLSASQLARSAMARQARMLVHDLRRVVKAGDPANAQYLDAFLVDLSALEQNPLAPAGSDGAIVSRQSFSIVEIVEASLGAIYPGLKRDGLQVSVAWRHQSRLSADPRAMRRVMDNLLDNAAANSVAGSRIQISTREETVSRGDESHPCCVIEVSNVVVAYNPSDFAVLGGGRVRDRKDGRGLGLVIVRRLAESMAGTVRHRHEVSSSRLSIEVAIPVDRGLPDLLAVARSPGVDEATGAFIERRMLIVVDDSPFVRDKWERQTVDADILVFASPEELLVRLSAAGDQILSRRPILVADYHFDGSPMDGVALARKAMAAGIRDVVICSDWDLGNLELNGIRLPVVRKGEASVGRVMSALQKPSA